MLGEEMSVSDPQSSGQNTHGPRDMEDNRRKAQALQEKNRKAQRRFRERQKVTGTPHINPENWLLNHLGHAALSRYREYTSMHQPYLHTLTQTLQNTFAAIYVQKYNYWTRTCIPTGIALH
jgi:hypothetical protein